MDVNQVTIDPVHPVIIVTNPERLGGTPCFVDTRVPVAVLLENLADGLTIDESLTNVRASPETSRSKRFGRATPVLD